MNFNFSIKAADFKHTRFIDIDTVLSRSDIPINAKEILSQIKISQLFRTCSLSVILSPALNMESSLDYLEDSLNLACETMKTEKYSRFILGVIEENHQKKLAIIIGPDSILEDLEIQRQLL